MSAEFLGIALVLAVLAALLVAIPLWRYRKTEHTKRSFAVGLMLILALPLAVLALYSQTTSYPWDNPEQLQGQPRTAGSGNPAMAGPIEGMVKQLEERMEAEPTVEGLAMLGRSYINMERVDDGVDAYHRAWEMSEGKDPGVNLGYAEALLLADRNTILTSAGDLLDSVLLALPNNPKALWYGGMSSVARGNMDQAQQRLVHLLDQPDIPDQLRTIVQQQLAGMGVDAPLADIGEAGNASQPASGATMSAAIDVSPELQSKVQKSAVLFVFARETGQPGPPAAVKRIPRPTFPLTVTLTDADSMMGNKALSGVKNLTLVARLSNGGNATATSGDLYGEIQPDWPGNSARINIDSTVP